MDSLFDIVNEATRVGIIGLIPSVCIVIAGFLGALITSSFGVAENSLNYAFKVAALIALMLITGPRLSEALIALAVRAFG